PAATHEVVQLVPAAATDVEDARPAAARRELGDALAEEVDGIRIGEEAAQIRVPQIVEEHPEPVESRARRLLIGRIVIGIPGVNRGSSRPRRDVLERAVVAFDQLELAGQTVAAIFDGEEVALLRVAAQVAGGNLELELHRKPPYHRTSLG